MATNLDLARASFAAFKAGDADSYVDSFSEDVRWSVSAFVTGKTEYSGREGVREFLGDLEQLRRERGERLQVELTEFRELDGNRVMALGEARILRDHDPLESEAGTIYRFDRGLIVELQAFTSAEQTRKAAGLPP